MFYDDADLVGEELSLKIIKTFPITQKNDIPSYLFAMIRNADGKKIGECTLRLKDDVNIYYRDNISFTVQKEFRGHNYAVKAVQLILVQAKKHNLPYILITCEKDSLPSAKAIAKAGGCFIEENEVPPYTAVYTAGERVKKIFKFSLSERS